MSALSMSGRGGRGRVGQREIEEGEGHRGNRGKGKREQRGAKVKLGLKIGLQLAKRNAFELIHQSHGRRGKRWE